MKGGDLFELTQGCIETNAIGSVRARGFQTYRNKVVRDIFRCEVSTACACSSAIKKIICQIVHDIPRSLGIKVLQELDVVGIGSSKNRHGQGGCRKNQHHGNKKRSHFSPNAVEQAAHIKPLTKDFYAKAH